MRKFTGLVVFAFIISLFIKCGAPVKISLSCADSVVSGICTVWVDVTFTEDVTDAYFYVDNQIAGQKSGYYLDFPLAFEWNTIYFADGEHSLKVSVTYYTDGTEEERFSNVLKVTTKNSPKIDSNLIENSSFENGDIGWDIFNARVISQNPHSGNRCLFIEPEEDAEAYQDKKIHAEKSHKYLVSLWYKGNGAKVCIYFETGSPIEKSLSISDTWTFYDFTFSPSKDVDVIYKFGIEGWGDTCYIDDIQFKRIK